MPRKTKPAPERFWAKVNRDGPVPDRYPELGPCWLWTACTIRGGYGLFAVERVGTMAHLYSLKLAGITVPDGLLACHKCDVPACVNPTHIFFGTQSQNLMDASRKGRIAKGSSNGNSRLTEEQVAEIKRRYVRGQGAALAREFGVDKTIVSNIMRGLMWKHV